MIRQIFVHSSDTVELLFIGTFFMPCMPQLLYYTFDRFTSIKYYIRTFIIQFKCENYTKMLLFAHKCALRC